MRKIELNPATDLVLDRTVDVSPELVWKAWTVPKHLMPWFCPLPWKTIECEIDLRPGGKFYTVMQSPEGQKFPGTGCYLEVTPNERLIWTSALGPDYRPNEAVENHPTFTAILTLEKKGSGTRYLVQALHSSAAIREMHEKMGFEQGWGIALYQMVAYLKSI